MCVWWWWGGLVVWAFGKDCLDVDALHTFRFDLLLLPTDSSRFTIKTTTPRPNHQPTKQPTNRPTNQPPHRAALKASAQGAQFSCSQSAVNEADPQWQNALDIKIPDFSISAHNKVGFWFFVCLCGAVDWRAD
jgi:hypothetical protein